EWNKTSAARTDELAVHALLLPRIQAESVALILAMAVNSCGAPRGGHCRGATHVRHRGCLSISANTSGGKSRRHATSGKGAPADTGSRRYRLGSPRTSASLARS